MDALLFCQTCEENRVHRKDEEGALCCTKCGTKQSAVQPEPALAEARV